jgi:hypothetical protein
MEKKKPALEGWESEFRRYRILVKTFRKNEIEHQNLEIFTTGLSQLLEMRKIHSVAFHPSGREDFPVLVKNN